MKIYLAKSNASCFEVYSLVKKKLLSTGHEIIEFSGGKYDADSILQADMLFIVPPNKTMSDLVVYTRSEGHSARRFDFNEDGEYGDYTVGMGQSQQILHWMNSKHKASVSTNGKDNYQFDEINDVLILKTVEAEGTENIVLNVDYIDGMQITKDEMKEDYANIDVSSDEYDIDILIPTIEGAIPGVVSSEIMLGATMFYPV